MPPDAQAGPADTPRSDPRSGASGARRVSPAFWAGWLLAILLGAAGIAAVVDRLAERHLIADAEQTSLAWAEHLARAVPDIDLVFQGELASPPAQDALGSMRGTAGLHRFQLFDTEGRRLLVSESLGTPVANDERGVDVEARAVAHGGPARVSLHRGSEGREPRAWTRGHVPVRHGTKILGVAAIDLDQSARAALTARTARTGAASAALALALILAAGALVLRQRLERERRHEERLRYLVQHDPLTGALNRSSFRDALVRARATARRAGDRYAVLCVDLDRFKEVNDLHGHAVGDRLLHSIADRLRGLMRGGDLVARLGADQFAVLQGRVEGHAAVAALAQRIVSALGAGHDLGGTRLETTVCVGAAIHGVDGDEPDALLHAAELALSRAKTSGRGAWGFYDAALDKALQDRRMLAHDLREALGQDALRLHFQPVFAAAGALLGYEALARWPHPLRGFVPPSEFIALAEESGLILALGRWVLESACREAASWPEPLRVAVNLSPAQFGAQSNLLELVDGALVQSGLPACRLELEITESLLLGHGEHVLRTLNALQRRGVRLAMDDFGTGYSSLAYLWRFPFDKVKIDRAFTQRLGREAKVDLIVRSIVQLAHALSIRVNAEGVETDEQRDVLRASGCDELQGFLLGRPQPSQQLVHRTARTWAPSAPGVAQSPLAATLAASPAQPPPSPPARAGEVGAMAVD
jgi:diguanylate cyclase (GGDEF)-like protein